MALTARGAIMAAGDISVDLDHTPAIYEALWDDDFDVPRNLFILVFDGNDALAYPPFVLRRVDGGKEGLKIGGPGILWVLGNSDVGPTIRDREYLSGANKLSNPLDPANPLDPSDLLWTVGDSIWVIGPGYAYLNPATDNFDDQLLISEEKFRAVPGATYSSTVSIGRVPGYTIGRLRLRHVYTGGPFVHADELPLFSTWDGSVGTNLGQHDIAYDSGSLAFIIGPSAMPNLIPNGSFDDGGGSLNGFIPIGGTWGLGTDGGHNGTYYMHTDGGPAWKEIASSSDGAVSGAVVPQPAIPGEEYQMWMVARTNPGSPATDGTTHMLAGITGTTTTFVGGENNVSPDNGVGNWQLARTFITIPDGANALTPQIVVDDQSTGRWDFDDVTLIRTKGNVDYVTSPIFAITPGRGYRWTQPYTTDAGVREGTVSLAMVCFVATRPAIILQGPSLRLTGGASETIEWEFTPPSGMDVCMARIVCQDVVGGSVRFPNAGASIRQSDTSSKVYEAISPTTAPVTVPLTLSAPAPEGAKEIHLELVAEAYGIGWIASLFDLIRVTADPATGNDIVADLLLDPTTGDPLSIGAGTITCPETIPYDWRQINLTNRAALDHYCTVVSLPTREYRLTASLPPLLDVATAAILWPDPGPASAFLADDIDVGEIAPPATDTAGRATEIVLLGNERQLVSGGTHLITARSVVPGPVEQDINGRPIVRTKPVTDGTVDHQGYAQARADDLAAQEADPPWAVKVKLTGTDRAPGVESGQTVYLYKPDAGITDESTSVSIDGVTVFPRRGRVLELQREHGPSYYVVMLEPDGTTWPLPGVLPSDADTTEITVGNRMPVEWTADPQGGAAGRQYLADRASRPR